MAATPDCRSDGLQRGGGALSTIGSGGYAPKCFWNFIEILCALCAFLGGTLITILVTLHVVAKPVELNYNEHLPKSEMGYPLARKVRNLYGRLRCPGAHWIQVGLAFRRLCQTYSLCSNSEWSRSNRKPSQPGQGHREFPFRNVKIPSHSVQKFPKIPVTKSSIRVRLHRHKSNR